MTQSKINPQVSTTHTNLEMTTEMSVISVESTFHWIDQKQSTSNPGMSNSIDNKQNHDVRYEVLSIIDNRVKNIWVLGI